MPHLWINIISHFWRCKYLSHHFWLDIGKSSQKWCNKRTFLGALTYVANPNSEKSEEHKDDSLLWTSAHQIIKEELHGCIKSSIRAWTSSERIHRSHWSGAAVHRIQFQSSNFISWGTMFKYIAFLRETMLIFGEREAIYYFCSIEIATSTTILFRLSIMLELDMRVTSNTWKWTALNPLFVFDYTGG